jgi:hypothetical protein
LLLKTDEIELDGLNENLLIGKNVVVPVVPRKRFFFNSEESEQIIEPCKPRGFFKLQPNQRCC